MTLGACLTAGTVARASQEAGKVFVGAFASACIPERLSYDKTLAQAKAKGWTPVERTAHRELAAVMAKSDAGLAEAKADGIEMGFAVEFFEKTVSDRKLHLVVSLTESDYIDEIGCYLYDFEAVEAMPFGPVSDVLGIKPANVLREDGVVGAVWGPPPSMPRTLDTYLTFVPPGSSYVEQSGFDGLVLKFSTSRPEEG